MELAILETIAPVLVFLGLSGAVLIGMKMRYTHIQRTKVGGSSQEDVKRLTDVVSVLHDEVRLLREDYHELNERVLFTERLLERPRGGKADSKELPGQ